MLVHYRWAAAAVPLVVAMVLGGLVYDAEDATSSAIGYGIGLGLGALGLTALVRFLHLRFTMRRDVPVWSPALLRTAGLVALVCAAILAIGDTTAVV